MEINMRKLLVGLILLSTLVSGCMTYRGVVVSPDGKRYEVQQSRPGKISVEDKDVKISADTQAESRVDKLLDYLMLREIRQKE